MTTNIDMTTMTPQHIAKRHKNKTTRDPKRKVSRKWEKHRRKVTISSHTQQAFLWFFFGFFSLDLAVGSSSHFSSLHNDKQFSSRKQGGKGKRNCHRKWGGKFIQYEWEIRRETTQDEIFLLEEMKIIFFSLFPFLPCEAKSFEIWVAQSWKQRQQSFREL